MKRTVKAILLVLLGFVLCYGLMFAVSVQRTRRSISMSTGNDPDPLNLPSAQESEMRTTVHDLFSKGDVGRVNEMLKVEEGEIELRINGPTSFPELHTPVAEVVLQNQSKRNLTIFQPHVQRLTPESYEHDGYLQDDFSMNCPLTRESRCHVLSPGGALSIPVMFRVKGVGPHKINLDVSFPAYKDISARYVSSQGTVSARSSYTFEITKEQD